MTPEIAAIASELDRAADRGLALELWWRDDDAVAPNPALDRLLAISADEGWPIGIAAIPAGLEPSLGERLRAEPAGHRILVHGLAHLNHAGPGEKPAEFGPHRAMSRLLADAAEGLRRVRAVGGDLVLPVFVPPWNRLDPRLTGVLEQAGFEGLSAFGEREASPFASGKLVRADLHLDPVDWRGHRGLLAAAPLAAQLRRAIEAGARRIGFLSHHLVFDEPTWAFTAEFARLVARHAAVDCRGPDAIFGRVSGGSNRVGPAELSSGRHVLAEAPR